MYLDNQSLKVILFFMFVFTPEFKEKICVY